MSFQVFVCVFLVQQLDWFATAHNRNSKMRAICNPIFRSRYSVSIIHDWGNLIAAVWISRGISIMLVFYAAFLLDFVKSFVEKSKRWEFWSFSKVSLNFKLLSQISNSLSPYWISFNFQLLLFDFTLTSLFLLFSLNFSSNLRSHDVIFS